MYHIVFTHSSVDGHLGCFNLLAIVSAAVNTGLQAFFEHVFYFRCATRSGISESYSNSVFNILGSYKTFPQWVHIL